jgi:uncharacterized heparinase superfamily protein
VISALDRAFLYWHTIRHLRPHQVYGRILFHAWKPSVDRRPAPPRRRVIGPWVMPAVREPRMTGPSTLRLIGLERDISRDGWCPADVDLLWHYNAHYFDDLNARDAAARAHWHGPLIMRWLDEVHPGSRPSWDPYPLSTRVVNWIKYALRGGELTHAAVNSLAAQARWLSKRIEWHLEGNHLWLNGKALMFCGMFFQGAEADRWRRLGERIIARELQEQVMADGGHFERSPMYHSLVLEDALDLMNASRAFGFEAGPVFEAVASRIDRMRRWLVNMTHPDGEISFFNDSAFGVAPAPNEIDRYARRLEFPEAESPCFGVTHLKHSGYVRLQQGPAVLLMDVGEIGPDHCPAHVHADTLSLELSLDGHRCLVNSGTSCYGASPERARQRGTPAHNAASIGALDSSEVWGSFRVARRARPFGLGIDMQGSACTVRCSHDGYSRRSSTLVSRSITLDDGGLSVVDSAASRHPLVAWWHLHPSVRGEAPGTLEVGSRGVRCSAIDAATGMVEASWHPEFGVVLPARCIRVEAPRGSCTSFFRWGVAS